MMRNEPVRSGTTPDADSAPVQADPDAVDPSGSGNSSYIVPSSADHPHILVEDEEGLEGSDGDDEYEEELASYLTPSRSNTQDQSIHSDQSENLCVICMASQIEITLRPCGHRCLCELCYSLVCAGGVQDHNSRPIAPRCPLCRQDVQLDSVPDDPREDVPMSPMSPEQRDAAHRNVQDDEAMHEIGRMVRERSERRNRPDRAA